VNWESLITERAKHMVPSVAAEIIRLSSGHDVISFGGGMPDPALYPAIELQEMLARVLTQETAQSLTYAPVGGFDGLRQLLAQRASAEGAPTLAENVLIVNGAYQGISVVAEVLLSPGDIVIVEEPTFSGALEIFAKHQSRVVGVPTDEQGIRTDMLEEQLARTGAKLIYLMPNKHNPLGIDMSLERRRALLGLCSQFGVPVLTDDPYGALRYFGEPPVPLRALEGSEAVIAVSTFSKTIAPGIRLGWLEAPKAIVERLTLAKKDSDRSANNPMQRAVYHMIRDGAFDRHLANLVENYRQKLDYTLTALQDLLPDGIVWTKPSGGFFVWLTLPEGIDAQEVLERSVERGVVFTAGAHFFPAKNRRNNIRLAFSQTPTERIREGVQRLAAALGEVM